MLLPERAPAANKARLGFFVATEGVEADLTKELEKGECALDSELVDRLFTFQELENHKNGKGEFVYHNRVSPDKGGIYSIFFANCEPQGVVSFDIQMSLYNEKANGAKDYLSVGESMLPTVYTLAFILFLILGVIWALTLSKKRAMAHRVHYFMGVLIIFKALTVLSQAGMYHYLRTTGVPDGWNVAYYIFTFIRGLMFFAALILIGTGWSYMKPFLSEQDKRIFLVVIPLQVFANIAIVILDEDTPATESWFTWRDIFHLVDIICCCAVLFPLVWSIKRLRDTAEIDGKASRNIVKLTLFRQFYVMVVAYIYFTRIVVYLLTSVLPYEYTWASNAIGELATLLFYVLTGMKFIPASNNPYLSLEQRELDAF